MRIDRYERRHGRPAARLDSSGQAARNLRIREVVARLAAAHRDVLEVRDWRRADADGLRRETYVFGHGRRDGIRGVTLAPDGERGPWPAVLVCQGRNATLERMTGLAAPDYPDRDVAVHLARAGYLTLTLDYGIDGALDPARLGGRDTADALDGVYRLYGGSLLAALCEDALAALAWLTSCPDAAPGRLGIFGHSLGAAVALHAALLWDEPLPLCAASHIGSYLFMLGRSLGWNQYAALPSILRYADLADLYAALAPGPLQVQYGDADPHICPDDAAAAGKRIQECYAAVDSADAVEVVALPMGHGTGLPQAAGFFDRALATPRIPTPDVPAGQVGFDVADRWEIADFVDESLASGRLTLGPHGDRLEELASLRLGRDVTAVSSGSSALEIALRIVGVAGRTVLMPANTFVATATSVLHAGGRVAFVDIELDGLGLDPDDLRSALDAHDDVAAVIPVHTAGIVSPRLAEVLAECAGRGVPVVEDAAHALGSDLHGKPAGTFGRLAAFSLYPTKVVTSGEGGLVVAGPGDCDSARCLRDHGKRSFGENLHVKLGSNWRMGELHAAVGVSQFARLDEVLSSRRRLAAWYDRNLSRVPALTRHIVPEGCAANFYKYLAYLPAEVDRTVLKRRLRDHGVALAGEVYDIPLHRQPVFAETRERRSFPRAEWFAGRHICLPLFRGMTTRQQEHVIIQLRHVLS